MSRAKAPRQRDDDRQVTKRIRVLALGALLLFPATALANNPPQPGTVTVSAVTQDSAQVSGHLNLDGDAGYWFEYGTSTEYGRQSSFGTATQDGGVSRTLSTLAAGTTYHVRLVAWNDEEGYGRGPDRTFTTTAAVAAAPPTETPPPTPGETPPSNDAVATAAPVLGATVALEATRGIIRVHSPGSTGYAALGDLASLPVGTVVDASRGTVELQSALPDGTTQTGRFRGARFQIRQSAAGAGVTNLHLRGGNLTDCSDRTGRSKLASAAGKRKQPARRLWGSDSGGRFRTHGRDSVATVRGTRWSVTDSCAGTLTRVTEGAVDVRVRATGRVTRVAAGEHHFARHQR